MFARFILTAAFVLAPVLVADPGYHGGGFPGPRYNPGGYPGHNPGGYPGHNPGGYPGHNPGGYPGHNPGGYPGPGGYPDHNPGGYPPYNPGPQVQTTCYASNARGMQFVGVGYGFNAQGEAAGQALGICRMNSIIPLTCRITNCF